LSKSKKTPRKAYERSTPVGRVKKSLEKINRIASVVFSRLLVWEKAGSAEIARAMGDVEKISKAAESALLNVAMLGAHWAPPKKSSAVSFEENDKVRIAKRHLDRWSQVYTPKSLGKLTVVSLVDAGVVVRYENGTPFLVAKTHLEHRREPKKSKEANGSFKNSEVR
jgi:hypothetical protein